MHDLRIEPSRFADPGCDGQGPGRMNSRPVRGVDNHPPITELVSKALNEKGVVVGQLPGGLTLFVYVGDEIGCGPVIKPCGGEPLSDVRFLPVGDCPDECADRLT